MNGFNLIYYINFGAPSIAASQEMMRFYARCGANNLQLDLPSREPDPAMENTFVMNRMQQALTACDNLQLYLNAIAAVKREIPELNVEMTVYEDTVAQVGVEAFIDFCCVADVKRLSWIPKRNNPDSTLVKALRDAGLLILHPMLFHIPQEELEDAVKRKEPVILMLEDGSNEALRPGCEHLSGALNFLKRQGVVDPIYVTMGIRSPERAQEVKQMGAHGAYVGSVLMKAWDNPGKLECLIRAFEAVKTAEEREGVS